MQTKIITKIAILSAISYLLQIVGGMIPKVSGFLEIEFSDFPAIIAAFSMGPLYGVFVELIKNLLHLITVSTTGGVGEFANFIVNSTFILTCGYIYRINKSKKIALISLIIGTVAMTVAGILANYFIMVPMFIPNVDFNTNITLVLSVITPFNFVKGIVLSLLTFFLYKKIAPLLK